MSMLLSAAGYGGLGATPLARPGYYNQIIGRVYERDFIPEITSSEIDERIVRCNQQVHIMKAPVVGPWRTYTANQELVPNQITADGVCLQICNAAYNAIKVDKTDIHFACERWTMWEESFLDAVYEAYVEMIRPWVLTAMIMETSPRNKGTNAGKYGNINLGASGNPVIVNKDNIILELFNIAQVLRDQIRFTEGEMFIIMPSLFRLVLAQSNYADSSWVGGCKPCSFGIDGMWDTKLAGFNVIETVHAPMVADDNGKLCFYIIAGHRDAFAFASDIIEGRLVEPTQTFSVEYQMLAVWGGKMIYPESMAVAYWTFQTT